jgi:hypothetical protein
MTCHNPSASLRSIADTDPEIVPSSARSTSSTASPLPNHLVPLLSSPLDRLKEAVDDVLPRHKDKTALEEAMYEEDEGGLAGAEILQSAFSQRLRGCK